MGLLKTLQGIRGGGTPIWFMRQAGRYLPEYRAIRETQKDFISFCLDPAAASEVTLQPIRRFGFDAAIIFSDILLIPWAMGCGVRFVEGEGPRLDALASPDDIARLCGEAAYIDMTDSLAPIFEALRRTRTALDATTDLIGFCGAPWTVATYMLEGRRSDFAKSVSWLDAHPEAMTALLNRLADYSIDLLHAKARAGASVLMIFDSWAGEVPCAHHMAAIHAPTKRIVEGLRARGVTAPIIGFGKGLEAEALPGYAAATGITAIGLDHAIDPARADSVLPKSLPVQGNLDPALLLAGGREMLAATDTILDAFAARPHVFNLGHGIHKDTPPEHVDEVVSHIRKSGA